MKNHIAEELPARKFAPAAAGSGPTDKNNKKEDSGKSPEQKAKQAVYDIRYRARREGIPLPQAFSQYMQNSSMGGEERKIVKAKLFGKEGGGMKAEDFNPIFKDAASDNVAKALFKVFVEGTEQEPISLTYLEELDSPEHRKYKVRVTDKNTKRSYVRMATREKINQLRANPNIESVEMTEYGEPYEGERKKGSQTARVAAGKGLDPVGKEDGDVDNDGDKDKSDKYLMKRRGAIGNAIATRKEEFIHEAETEDSNNKKIDVMKKGKKNKVTIAPAQDKSVGLMAHNELEGELIAETGYSKFLDMIQEKKLTKAEKAKKEQIVKSLKPKYGKTSKTYAIATSVAKEVAEEMECDSDGMKKKGEEEDPRSMKTKVNLVKNKLRAMGLKMSYEPEGNQIDEIAPLVVGGLALGAAALGAKAASDNMKKDRTGGGKVRPNTIQSNIQKRRAAESELMNQSYELGGEVLEDYMRVNSDGSRERVAGDPPKAKLKRKPLGHTPEQKRQMNKQPKTDYRPRRGESD